MRLYLVSKNEINNKKYENRIDFFYLLKNDCDLNTQKICF